MSQHDYDIANQTAPNFRADLNLALKALASQSSGASAPTTTYANMMWYDETNNQLKQRNEANNAWIVVGTYDQTGNTFKPSGALTPGETTAQALGTSGFTATSDNDGTISSGTYTPTPNGGNMKHYTNNGAHTLAAPSASGDYTLTIHITNSASAGAVTMSGFTKSDGDAFTTTNGHKFFVFVVKQNGSVYANVKALQ